jgi:hypothetical protein
MVYDFNAKIYKYLHLLSMSEGLVCIVKQAVKLMSLYFSFFR